MAGFGGGAGQCMGVHEEDVPGFAIEYTITMHVLVDVV